MALILNIDTALDTASVSLAEDGKVLQSALNESQKDHAAWLQPAIKKLLDDSGCKMKQLNAVAVSNGPGSYTGLRVGLSTAKGICYALNIPLITIGTLGLMAFSAIRNNMDSGLMIKDFLFCPMIDARRMEVFTAVFDLDLNELVKPHALILNEHSFDELLKGQKILFLGNGSEKFQKICRNPQAVFKKFPLNPPALASLTYKSFIGNNFAELAYTEPLYLKEFFTIQAIRPANPR